MFKLATLFSLLLTAASGQITIDPVTFNQCETANISWSGGTAPYYVYIYPNWKDPVAQEFSYYAKLAPIDTTSTSWLVILPADEVLRVNVRGSDDILIVEDFTPAITIGSGSSDACIDAGMARFSDSSLLDGGPTSTGGSSTQPTGTGSITSMGMTRGPVSVSPSGTATSSSRSSSTSNSGVAEIPFTWGNLLISLISSAGFYMAFGTV